MGMCIKGPGAKNKKNVLSPISLGWVIGLLEK